jgi:hypothetical protein
MSYSNDYNLGISGDAKTAALKDLRYEADSWCNGSIRCQDGNGYTGQPYAKNVKDPRTMTSADCGCRPFYGRSGNSPTQKAGRHAGYGNMIPRTVGVNGLNESFIESLEYNGMSGLSGTFDYKKCLARARGDAYNVQACKDRQGCETHCESIMVGVCQDGSVMKSSVNPNGGCGCRCVTGVRVGPSSGGYGNIIPLATPKGRTNTVNGVDGLNESFIESLGSIGNLAIIGLAIYGGFCLAKKI